MESLAFFLPSFIWVLIGLKIVNKMELPKYYILICCGLGFVGMVIVIVLGLRKQSVISENIARQMENRQEQQDIFMADIPIYRNQQMQGNYQVYGEQQMQGNYQTYGEQQVQGNYQTYGEKQMQGNYQAYGNQQMSENHQVYGNQQIHIEQKTDKNQQIDNKHINNQQMNKHSFEQMNVKQNNDDFDFYNDDSNLFNDDSDFYDEYYSIMYDNVTYYDEDNYQASSLGKLNECENHYGGQETFESSYGGYDINDNYRYKLNGESVTSGKRCPHCGAVISKNASYCDTCGSRA